MSNGLNLTYQVTINSLMALLLAHWLKNILSTDSISLHGNTLKRKVLYGPLKLKWSFFNISWVLSKVGVSNLHQTIGNYK